MEVIFLNRSAFKIIDYGFVDSDFQIILDSVVLQKSTFQVNKQNINAETGDFLVVKDKKINYIGIICSIEEDKEKGYTKVQTNDFISILDIKVKLSSYSGNVSQYLYNLISNAYITNADGYQKMPFLTIAKDYNSVAGSLTFEADTIDSISSVLNTLNKAYSIGIYYNLTYDNGRINGIELHIAGCRKGLILKSDFKDIMNLVISNGNDQSINKIVFVPSYENITYKNIINYYLLTDGSVSTVSTSPLRFKKVSMTTKIYKDADYSSLRTTAQSEMLISSLEHSISFNLKIENKVVIPFKDIQVGDFIEFITPNKTYQTMVTQFILKNNLYQVGVTLGEYRISLTDKIKLLSKK